MGIHTLLLNAYAAYYVMDPTANEQYTWLRVNRACADTYFGSNGIVTDVFNSYLGGIA